MRTKVQKSKETKVLEMANFSGKTVYVGIDVHKKLWACTVYLEEQFYKTFTQPPIGEALKTFLENHFPGANYQSCYEAGFCGFSVHRDLERNGINCIVVNPADVPQTAKDSLTKTDKIDSKRLATALCKGMLKAIYIPSQIDESDRKLMRYRTTVQREMAEHKRRIRSLLFTLEIKIPQELDKPYWSKKMLQWLQDLPITQLGAKSAMDLMLDDLIHSRNKLYTVTSQIKKLSETDKYRALMGLLRSAPGIGLIVGMTLITEIMDINRFSNFSKFNSFVGLYPNQFSSGESTRMGKMTPRHNNYLRPLIIEAAWIAIRHDSALALKFSEDCKRKTKKRAIVTIARKLLSRIYTVWNDGIFYQKGLR